MSSPAPSPEAAPLTRATPADNQLLADRLRRAEITASGFAEQVSELNPPAEPGEACWLCEKHPATHELKCCWTYPRPISKHWNGFLLNKLVYAFLKLAPTKFHGIEGGNEFDSINDDPSNLRFATAHPVDEACGRTVMRRNKLCSFFQSLCMMTCRLTMIFCLVVLYGLYQWWMGESGLNDRQIRITLFAFGLMIGVIVVYIYFSRIRLVRPLRHIQSWPVSLLGMALVQFPLDPASQAARLKRQRQASTARPA